MSAASAAGLYRLVRPLLFSLSAETAHDFSMRLLPLLRASGMLNLLCGAPVSDPVTLMNIRFPNRVGLAAGLDKNARHLDALMQMGFGFVEVGTVTPRPQPGNPKPRMFRLPAASALINRMGFNNDGLDVFLANVQHHLTAQSAVHGNNRVPIGLNIGKNASTPIEHAVDDYLAGLRGVYSAADYIAINISSPNTSNLRALQQESELDAMLSAITDARESLIVAHGKRVPLVVKIAPDLVHEQVTAIAQTLVRHNIDGVIATNTTLARDAVSGLPHATETGGLSGQPVHEQSNTIIRQLRAALPAGFPIIGVGGIVSAADVQDKLAAGADLVQLYTGLVYRGPQLVTEAANAARRYCAGS